MIYIDVLRVKCNRRWGISINDLTLYMERLKASHNSMGDHSGGFKKIKIYCNVILPTNHGSMLIIKCHKKGSHKYKIFKR